MRGYELCLILHSDITDEDIDALTNSIGETIAKQNGTVLKVEKWGKKNFKFTIKKQSKGNYCFVYFSAPSDVLRDIDRLIRFNERILRYNVVRLPKGFTVEQAEPVVEEAAETVAEPETEEAPKAEQAEEGTPSAEATE